MSFSSEEFVSLDPNSVSFTLDFANDKLFRCGSLGCFEKSYLCWDESLSLLKYFMQCYLWE